MSQSKKKRSRSANASSSEEREDSDRPVEPHRPLVEDSKKITLAIRKLNSELSCPICLNIRRDTVAVTACLHRFCNTCIETSLRLSKRECPACRVACPSRRNLRSDPLFDKLIATFYPDLDSAHKQQHDMTVDILNSRNPMQNEAKANLEEQQAAAKRQRLLHGRSSRAAEVDDAPSTSTSSNSGPIDQTKLHLIINTDEDEVNAKFFAGPEYQTVNSDVTVEHLRAYVMKKVHTVLGREAKGVAFYVGSAQKPLLDICTMRYVAQHLWQGDGDIQLVAAVAL